MRVERGGTIGGAAQRDARLGRDRGALLPLGVGPIGVEVVRRQDAGDLVVAEALEVARGGEVPGSAVAARERSVRDLADEPMDEAVLPALRGARVDVELEELASNEVAQPRLERLGILARHRGDAGEREAEAEDRRLLDECPVARLEAVEASGDERLE